MSSDEARIGFFKLRDHLSHDLLKNIFFAGLQPCWDGSDRFTDRDVVFRALLGDDCAMRDAHEVLGVWRSHVGPALLELVRSVGPRFGFVTSDEWRQDCAAAEAAAAMIDEMRFHVPLTDADARTLAGDFWRSCDVIRDFVAAMKLRFSRYFQEWDCSLIDES